MFIIRGLNRQHESFFITSLIAVFIPAIAILLIPLTIKYPDSKALSYGIALAFWIGLILEMFLVYKTNSILKKIESRIGEVSKERHLGVFLFFKTKASKIVDSLLFVSISVLIVTLFADLSFEWLYSFLISLVFILFNFHCLLNGINYLYIKNNKK